MRTFLLNIGRRGPRAAVAGMLLTLVVGALLVTPGIRHQHHGGDAPHHHGHSHRHSRSHSHSHGHGHSHSHGSASHQHGHSHSHDSHHHGSDDLSSQHSHIHISFLWFQLTLTDFLTARDTSANSTGLASESVSVADSEIITLPTSAAFNQLLLVLLVPALLLETRWLQFGRNFISWRMITNDQLNGRLRDEPMTPPPRGTSF